MRLKREPQRPFRTQEKTSLELDYRRVVTILDLSNPKFYNIPHGYELVDFDPAKTICDIDYEGGYGDIEVHIRVTITETDDYYAELMDDYLQTNGEYLAWYNANKENVDKELDKRPVDEANKREDRKERLLKEKAKLERRLIELGEV